MANQNSAKGNPASKRMSNPARSTRRSLCWQRGQKRKAERIEANRRRALDNKAIREIGTYESRLRSAESGGPGVWHLFLTPHEVKQLKRRLVRDELRRSGLIPRNEKEYDAKHPHRATGTVSMPASVTKSARKSRASVKK